MRIKTHLRAGLFFLLACLPAFAVTEEMMMVRTQMPFDVAMEELQLVLNEYGYKVAHTQRCDGGLADFGYKSDFYRIVFFGKITEVRLLSEKFPQLVPFLPLKMLVFAENDETVMVSLDPGTLSKYFNDPSIRIQLSRWHNDINSIFNEMRGKKHIPITVQSEKQ